MLYSKLFIVMGIAWIFECLHYVIHPDHTHTEELCYDSLELILRAISCFNLLRGSLIFFIFVCKDSILDKVKAEICQTNPVTASLPGVQTDGVRRTADFPAAETSPTFRQRHQQGILISPVRGAHQCPYQGTSETNTARTTHGRSE